MKEFIINAANICNTDGEFGLTWVEVAACEVSERSILFQKISEVLSDYFGNPFLKLKTVKLLGTGFVKI